MASAGGHVGIVTWAELVFLIDALIVLEGQSKAAGQDADRFVLDLVVLVGQPLARLDDQHLADVPIGVCPDELMSPRLFHPSRGCSSAGVDVAHDQFPRTRRSPDTSMASRRSSVVDSV